MRLPRFLGHAHALDPLDLGHDVDVGEVEKVFLVGVGIRAVNVHVHQHAGHDLADEDTLPHHQGRKLEQHDVDPVLHVHDIDVGVRARLEVDHDRCLAGTGGGGDHVTHVLDAVDRLLQRNQDRVDQNIGTGTGISNGDHHGRRRDIGKLGDRKGLDPQHPQEQEDNGDNDRQCRSIEDFCEHCFLLVMGGGCGDVPSGGSERRCRYPPPLPTIPRDFFGAQGRLPA